MQVRVATLADAEAITSVINAAFRRAESFFIDRNRVDLKDVRSLLGKGTFLIADDGGVVIGCVYLELRGDRAYLGLLSVDPQRQKGGLGSTLMTASERHCADAGCQFLDLQIVNLRTENHAFYTRRGYVETGTAPFPAELRTKLSCHFVKMSKPLT
jgi:N-acetylglutamate synthase-like GNAT family acetyltransferase